VAALLRAQYAPKGVLLTENGTAALTAALLTVLEARPGAPVAMPAYACYDLATVAHGARAPVLLYDVDPRTLGADLAQVEACLRRGAAAVVVAHLYGYPLDLTEVNRLASETGAVVIEDAAQAAGATLNGRAAGALGALSVLSFGRGKGVTGGSGGALLAHDDAGTHVVERARVLLGEPRRGWREVVTTAAQLLLQHPNLYGIPAALPFLHLGETIYREPRALRGPTAASSAILAATWPLADGEVATRRRNAERLLAVLQGHAGFTPVRPIAHARPGYLRLPVLASPEVRRAAVLPAARRLGVMPGYPKALSDLEALAPILLNGDAAFRFPGARLLADQLCTLPTHSRLESTDLARLEEWIRGVGAR
jgi:perosamine synthetase